MFVRKIKSNKGIIEVGRYGVDRIDVHDEGQVFGIGCKIFTIAGPVILYGILSSWVLGVIYWIGGVMGVI